MRTFYFSNMKPTKAQDRINGTTNMVTIPMPTDDIELVPPPQSEDITTKSADPFLVAFDPDYDSTNPKDWPSGVKWAVTDVMSATGFNRIMVSTILAPALPSIAASLSK
jgi:hypothetical protein